VIDGEVLQPQYFAIAADYAAARSSSSPPGATFIKSASGNCVMYCAASRNITKGFRPGELTRSKSR
jgi:hypothetical protein